MPTLYTALAGDYPSAAEFNTLVPKLAHKQADQSLISTITFTNDSVLFASTDANVKYEWRLFALIRAANASNGGMSVQFTAPAGSTVSDAMWRWGGNTSPGQPTNAQAGVNGLTLTTSNVFYEEWGLLVTGGSAGTFQFQWCQSGTSVNASIVAAGSFLTLRQVA